MTLREAATICLVRDANLGPEVLMVQRSDRARFMPDAWVFPGGVVDDGDASPEAFAAVRTSDDRPEERRVGKECNPRWSPSH